jgi:hypothetical protein
MNVDTEGLAMFLHVGLVVVAMSLASILHLSLIQMRRAETSAELRAWLPILRRVEPLMPLLALAVVGSGAWLIELSDGEFSWGQGWIVVSLVAVVIAEAVGASLNPRSHALARAIGAAGDTPVGPDLRRRAADPVLFFGGHFVTAVFFGVIFLMTAQPTGTWAPMLYIALAGVIGVLTAVPFVRPPDTCGAIDLSRIGHGH